MLVDIQRDKVETNIQSARQFTVTQNSAKLFSLLSTVLYTNKELAVIRENCDNAVDIHSITGQADRPIEITMPTKLDSVYRIRDFGTGLAEHDVYRLLTTYGESTKNNSNNEMGGWGIGFKSTAAVTDTWNIISYFGGEKKEYLIFVDAHGIPNITCIRSEKSDETGLEVIIPVNPNRHNVWENATREAFTHYAVKPIIKNSHINIPKVEYYYESDLYSIGTSAPDEYYSKVFIRISNRAYALNKTTLNQEISDKSLLNILSLNLFVSAAVGDIDLSLSREDIQYTKRTVAYIETKLKLIRDDLHSRIDNILSPATNGIEFRSFIHEVRKTIFNVRHDTTADNIIMEVIDSKYKKYNVKNLRRDIDKFSVDVATPTDYKIRVYRGKSIKNIKGDFNCWRSYIIESSVSDYKSKAITLTFSIKHLKNIKIVHDDIDRGADSRVRSWYSVGDTILITKNVSFIPDEMKASIVKASTLPKPVSVRKARGTTTVKYNTEIFKQSSSGRSWERVDPATINKDTSAYVYITNAKIGNSYEANIFPGKATGALITKLQSLGITVYGVKEKHGKPKGIKSLRDIINKIVAEVESKEFAAIWADEDFYKGMWYQGNDNIAILFSKKIKTTKDSVWNTWADKFQAATGYNNSTDQKLEIYEYVKGQWARPKSLAKELKKELTTKYPMIQYLNISRYNVDDATKKVVTDYIESLS